MANRTQDEKDFHRQDENYDPPFRGNAGNFKNTKGFAEPHGARGTQLSPNHTNGAKSGKKTKGQ